MSIRLCSTVLASALMAALLQSWPVIAPAADATPAKADVAVLMSQELLSGPDKEVLMLTVTYPAAGASLPHRHDAQVFVYVLEGELTMQVRGSPVVTLRPGQTFYETPADIHVVSANASQTAPAKILVVIIKDKAKPDTRPVTD
ncbi:MAG: cupin domain-containing protein [Steroidobacteraceae bacterium]